MTEELKPLNMKVPDAVRQKLDELTKKLSINRTAVLVMAVNEYHAQQILNAPILRRPAV